MSDRRTPAPQRPLQASPVQPPGQVLGIGGSGLVNADWAASKFVAKLGRQGEVRTALILNEAAQRPGGPTVLHHITPDGTSADIDHVLVAGNEVHMIDSKVWKPAAYWTFGGVHRRSFSLLSTEVAENLPTPEAIQRARGRLISHLEAAGVTGITIHGPHYVVWPSREGGTVSTLMLNLGEGTSIVPGASMQRFTRRIARKGTAHRPAVESLASLLHQGGGHR
jgi:hypothetical protein